MNRKSASNSKLKPTASPPTEKKSFPSVDNAGVDSRVFLDLDRPPLLSAVDWLLQKFSREISGYRHLDLSGLIVVVPTARAQQRLLQLLIGETEKQAINFSPPIIATLGQLPEYLYVAEKPLATELAQQIAWTKAIETISPADLERLTGRAADDQPRDWQPLAAMISRLHTRLANDIWSFHSVARAVADDTGFLKPEAARWEVLNAIQQQYYKILNEVNLWDKQAARNFAAAGLLRANEIRCATDKTIVMLGTADLNRSVSEMLRQLAATNEQQVRFLIAAPPQWADRFDSFGSLLTDPWLNVSIIIPDEKIRIVDQPADQAYAAACFISHLDNVATDEITIGVPDETIVPQLQRSLNALELKHRHLAGRPLQESSPVRLLLACREYLQTFRYEALAALVRHPDVFDWLACSVNSKVWLTELTHFQNSNLPGAIRLDDKQPFGNPKTILARFDPTDASSKKRAEKNAESADRLNRIHQCLVQLLEPLSGQSRPIAAWADPWIDVLLQIYATRELNKNHLHDRHTIVACEAIQNALNEQRRVPEKFNTVTTAMQALEWALTAAQNQRVVPPPIPDAIELAGWLDLTLDDAPVMAVTGMNDENVPSAESGHQFLPNELCKQLGVLDNDRRFARDCYALSVITSVRQQYQLIVGRRDEKGEPMKPSRLFFSDTAAVSANRAKAFFEYTGKPEMQFWLCEPDPNIKNQQFTIPRPVVSKPLTQISVTKFREFIKCPYRFYLKHGLGLESMTDDWRELDGGKFGDLTHNCLEAFGKSDVRDTTDIKSIFDFLNDQLNAFVKQQFGGSRLPAVRIQIEQLRLRFEKFAEKQSQRRRDGWQIVSTEEMLEHDFEVDGSPFRIRGKIDRVDRHQITNQIAVWDYKSSDKGDLPEKVHFAKRKNEWKDLQLPLYRHLVKEVNAVADCDFSDIVTGYILLPKNLDKVGFHQASWGADELALADETARAIIREIRASRYWPPTEKPPQYSEEFAAICQDRVFEPFEII